MSTNCESACDLGELTTSLELPEVSQSVAIGFPYAFFKLEESSPLEEVGDPFYRCKRPTRAWKLL